MADYDTPCDYILTETALIGNTITRPGPISFSGSPAPYFTPVDDEGIRRRKAYDDEQAAYKAQMNLAAAQNAVANLDSDIVGAITLMVQKEVKAQLAALSTAAAKSK